MGRWAKTEGEEECCGYLGVDYCAGNMTRLFAHALLWSCETTAQWPPAVSMQKAVINGTKQSTEFLCIWLKGSSFHDCCASVTFSCSARGLNRHKPIRCSECKSHSYVVYRHDSLERGEVPIINAKQQWAVRQRQRSNIMFWSARWFMENCWTCWAFSCSSKLAFPISISLSPCPTLNQQLTTCPVQ